MSLINRVSIFFLSALAVILCIYSFVFYSVTFRYIENQFASELRGVLSSLVAAAEVEETEVKWQPKEHAIHFGTQDEFGEVQWIVVGDEVQIVECSRVADDRLLAVAYKNQFLGRMDDGEVRTRNLEGWIFMSERVVAPNPQRLEREPDEFDQLTVTVGRSSVPRDAIYFRLLVFVTSLPLLAWSIAAFMGRWFVRKALLPVADMSRQAQVISGTDFKARLVFHYAGDELTELGTAFNRLLDRQQIAFDQQRRFAGDAAHELRTPLTVLLGQIEVTLRRPRGVSEYQSNLELLRGQTRYLQEIVESLLFLARSESDSESPPLRRIELQYWLESQSATWVAPTRSNDLQLDIRLSKTTCVLATPALLGRVIDNIVSNALKYSAPGSPIIVRAEEREGEAVIEVIDEGHGIAHEDMPRLFEPFFRSQDVRRRGIAGSGLGLAIAKRIATALGGRLECDRRSPRGTCFRLCLSIDNFKLESR
ncbi:Sensor kinase CusS [Pirellula sp. SH-Sr6A]|uniref:ATP-binding protein n=1 Tax=Pirellula sp. SH-Sr6A TaxID=1632865 RepID=UPI00078D7966|nr:ATP-binding protein [Pirellula sp. SH-Sr6A]AMV34809.1 Sensor kinase CusS [Pirellula sp. SH-Sr6A]